MNFDKLQRKLFLFIFFFLLFFENHSEHVSSRVYKNERRGNERKLIEHLWTSVRDLFSEGSIG